MINEERISKKLLIFDGIVLVLIVFILTIIYTRINSPKSDPIAKERMEVSSSAFFDNLSLEAESAYVYDVNSGKVLFEKNSDKQYPLASLTKLMMAVTAVEHFPKNAKITIKKEFLSEDGDSGLLANESWILENLLDLSLVVSSNDGARSIASVIGASLLQTQDYNLGRKEFISMMNKKASEIGLTNTYYINENGLDIENFSGGYGSAKDVAKLMQYMIANKPDILEATTYKKLTVESQSKSHSVNNTNTEIDKIPGLIGSKTGYTSQAGGNLVVAFDASIGRPIIVVAMGSTIEGRFSDVKSMVSASLDYIKE
ncbi:MAG: serine hydrolase [Minisyncoccia bacterium]